MRMNVLEDRLGRFNEKEFADADQKDLFDREVSCSCGIELVFVEDDPQDLECYHDALSFGRGYLQVNNKISLDLLNIAHGVLMTDHPDTTPGKIRKIQVRIGRHLPPPPNKVPEEYEGLIRFINDDQINPYHKIAWAHAFFELIHPYIDGNGRVGRILISYLLWKERLVSFDRIIPISEYLFYERSDYYKALSEAREDHDLYQKGEKGINQLSWVKYFLRVINKQLKNELNPHYLSSTYPDRNHFKNLEMYEMIKKLGGLPMVEGYNASKN